MLMGMFDYVTIEDAEELSHIDIDFPEDRVLQTKRLGKTLTDYIIRNKKLYKIHREWKRTDEIIREEGIFGEPIYKTKINKEWETPIEYHGDIELHGITEHEVKETFEFFDLIARFTEGELQWIKLATEVDDEHQ